MATELRLQCVFCEATTTDYVNSIRFLNYKAVELYCSICRKISVCKRVKITPRRR